MKQNNFIISKIEHINDSYFVLDIDAPELAKITTAGQFFEIKSDVQLLRIPISIYDVQNNIIRLMIKKLGEGTEALSKLNVGDNIDILGPLGNSFPLHQNKKVLLVSGGIGYPPLSFLKKNLQNCDVFWIHGGRTCDDVFPADMIFTDDGSKGRKGFVTVGVEEKLSLENFDIVYTCGPKIMMQNIFSIAKKYDVPVQVSLEEYMACGVGVCYGCVVPIIENEEIVYKRVCKDGAIFDAKTVVWDE